MSRRHILIPVTVILLMLCHIAAAKSIRQLDQHFNVPDGNISPWIFIPQDNIKEISTKEHPGLLTLWQAGKGRDLKGITKEPIKIDDYKLPWEFKMGLLQNYAAMLGFGSKDQMNYAIGLNIAVTFSDPNTWPKDRTQRPPDTHDFQLLVVHLGSTGEFGKGLPQFSKDSHPESYYLWGRGDLGGSATGDWKIPYIFSGYGPKFAGPASPQVYFKTTIISPSAMAVGFKWEESQDFVMRTIDCSKYGKITGIWEIGPIFSCDEWIPDVLCRNIPVERGNFPILTNDETSAEYKIKWTTFATPEPVAPDPVFEFYVDYCTFMYGPPAPLEELSDDFDIVGYMGNMRGVQIPIANTFMNPGYLTLMLTGPSQGAWWGPNGGYEMDLNIYPPPWEIETCFIAPDDTIPWNLYLIMETIGKNGQKIYWQPAVQNFPDQKKHKYVNTPYTKSSFDVHYPAGSLKRDINLEFEKEIPEEILSHKPLYWLIQVIDKSHVRMGFKAKKEDKWILSKVCNVSEFVGSEVEKYGTHCWGTVTGRHFNLPAGSPMYQKFLIDYVHYRYGLSTENK